MILPPFIDVHNHKLTPKCNNIISLYSFFVQNYEYPVNQNDSYFTIGLHPWHVDNVNLVEALHKIEQVAKLHTCVAIGEIGLDHLATASFDKQLKAFHEQVALAKSLQLPIIIHNVKSLQEIQLTLCNERFDLPVVFHGFTGKIEMAQQILRIGDTYLSFGKSLIEKGKNSILSMLPADRFFFETDESQYTIQQIYDAAYLQMGKPIESVKQIVYETFKKTFKKYNG